MTVGEFVMSVWNAGMERENSADIPRLILLWAWIHQDAK